MDRNGYFAQASVIDAMSAEHRLLWRSLFRACGPRIRPGLRVMDFGCGDGSMLAYLMLGDGKEWPGCRCALGLGIDTPALDEVLADAAGRFARELPVAFSSAAPGAFPGQFDLILSHEVIYLLPKLAETFRGLHAALRPGGAIVLATGCHNENVLYPGWTEAFARVGVRAHPYGIPDYVATLRDAGFEEIEDTRMRLSAADYEDWLKLRGGSEPNSDWFATAAEERTYYTEIGKALITARRSRIEKPANPSRGKGS